MSLDICTISQAAKTLGVSTGVVRSLSVAGHLESTAPGHETLVDMKDVRRLALFFTLAGVACDELDTALDSLRSEAEERGLIEPSKPETPANA